MGCTKKVITLNDNVARFQWRNEVRITSIGVWSNAINQININFNDIERYQGAIISVPSGIELSPVVTGFTWFPLDMEVIDIEFIAGSDRDAFCVVTFNEIANNGTLQNKTY